MLRLTLRAREDARFLARIIQRDGFVFVLDYGDPNTVADCSERVSRGFSLRREGLLVQIPPGADEMIPLLAEYYAQEGLLVMVDEAGSASAADTLPTNLEQRGLWMPPSPLPTDSVEDAPTELIEREPREELLAQEAETEFIPQDEDQ